MTRRADRLFQIVQILRGRRLTTAALLAERLGVSERTVYRDIRDLSLSGVPVEGEAGSGYRLLAGYDLPPLMLTTKESEAMIAAIRLLKRGGEALSQSLESAGKMLAILPEARRRRAEQTRLFAPISAPIAMLKPILTSFIRRSPASRCCSCAIRMRQAG